MKKRSTRFLGCVRIRHFVATPILIHMMKKNNDRDRTRTCNPQIRSLVPYPLGHTTHGSAGFQSCLKFSRQTFNKVAGQTEIHGRQIHP